MEVLDVPKSRQRPVWYWVYACRISSQLEYCRNCNVVARTHGSKWDSDDAWLDFDHLTPRSKGGRLTFDNATILCGSCNSRVKGNQDWSHRLPSLATEERLNPHRAYATQVYRAIGDITHTSFYRVSKGQSLDLISFGKYGEEDSELGEADFHPGS